MNGDDGRFYWFAYSAPENALMDFSNILHISRDGGAFADMQANFYEESPMRYGGKILNVPSAKCGDRAFAPTPRFHAHDVLVLPTRPPLDDDNDYDKRVVLRSGSPIEEYVLGRCRQVFKLSRRKAVILADKIAPKNEMRAVEYRMRNQGGSYQSTIYRHGAVANENQLGRLKEQCVATTLGYLAWLPGNPELGTPGVMVVFGIGGNETQLWGSYLRRQATGLIGALLRKNEARVMVAKFERPELETIPLDLSVVNAWGEIDWVIDAAVPNA